MRADLAASSWRGAGQEGRLEEEGGRVAEDDGFFLHRRTCRDLTLVCWTGPWLLRRRAALRTGAVPDLWKGWSDLETEFKPVSLGDELPCEIGYKFHALREGKIWIENLTV